MTQIKGGTGKETKEVEKAKMEKELKLIIQPKVIDHLG